MPITFLLDTGASVSLVPDTLIDELGVREGSFFEHEFYGVVEREECKVTAMIAQVIAKLEDRDGNQSPEFSILVAFTSVRPAYPLLGMKDCLERFLITMDFQAGHVILEWGENRNR